MDASQLLKTKVEAAAVTAGGAPDFLGQTVGTAGTAKMQQTKAAASGFLAGEGIPTGLMSLVGGDDGAGGSVGGVLSSIRSMGKGGLMAPGHQGTLLTKEEGVMPAADAIMEGFDVEGLLGQQATGAVSGMREPVPCAVC